MTKKDARPIVLYLRSFQDDSRIKLWARAANGRILAERLARVSFEEVVTDHLWGYGPVLAIGNPGASRALDEVGRKLWKPERTPLGAARDYADDSTWREKAIQMMQDATMIVVVAGATPGLAWEIETIVSLGAIRKLVIVLPPVSEEELQTRWKVVAGQFEGSLLPVRIDLPSGRAVVFPEGRPALITGRKGDDWTYEAALDEAALLIANESVAIHSVAIHSTASGRKRVPHVRRIKKVFSVLGSDIAGMVPGALALLSVVSIALVGNRVSMNTFPLAKLGDDRDYFVGEWMRNCGRDNPKLSWERLDKYCTCFATELANGIRMEELSQDQELEAKAISVAKQCWARTLGH